MYRDGIFKKDYELLRATNALIPLVLFLLAEARQKCSREKLQHPAPNIDNALFIKKMPVYVIRMLKDQHRP